MTSLYVILGIIVAIVLWAIVSYNSFVSLINRAKEAWADIEVQLKRRYDLIPNLVNTVKGYATHESTAFEKVTTARSAAMGAGNLSDKAQAENNLAGALKSVFAIAEAYPDLKANQNFLELQAARRFYNGNVRDLNIAIESFPGNAIASTFKFSQMELFDLAENDAAQQPVEVKF